MNKPTPQNEVAISTAKTLLIEAITAVGLPIAVSRSEKDGIMTIVVDEKGIIKATEDYGVQYAGQTLAELPVSELALLVDHGSRDPDVIEDLSYSNTPQLVTFSTSGLNHF